MSLRLDPCPTKTRADLEWERLLSAIADRCAGPLGRARALSLGFASTRDEALAWMAESEEATRARVEGSALPVEALSGVREALERLRVSAVLTPSELQALGRMLSAARALRRYLGVHRSRLPRLYQACATDPVLDESADEIARCIEPDGTLSDAASPSLKALRSEWHGARARMLSKMEELMDRHEGVLRDRFVTEREGRWVLPVRSDAHERFPGIVHGASSSGNTLFLEPRAVVALGNRLKVVQADVAREEEAVCARLTLQLSDVEPSLNGACEALALADLRAAVGRLAVDLELTFPAIADSPRLDLKRARHPLLALDRLRAGAAPGSSAVVSSDIVAEPGRALVISGPNAGGKTVALKTLGLAALMARSGLPVACSEPTSVGLFDVVLTDVGDDQSLQNSLSTFSAHVSNLAGALRESGPGALVLLDELASGTDPREGEALAAAVLDGLCARGGTVAVTTHYDGLKALALADDRFTNASVGFDLTTMTPTFELTIGIPGRSSALAVASRFGIPDPVIERARHFLAREDRDFEGTVKKLHDERAALLLARGAAEDREQEAEAARAALESERQALRARERQTLSDHAQTLMDRVRKAREELDQARAKLRAKKVEAPSLREAGQAIDRVAAEVAVGGPLEPIVEAPRAGGRVPLAELRKGARVWVPRLRSEGEVLAVLADGSVRVAAGAIKLTVQSDELMTVTPAPDKAAAPRRPGARDASVQEPRSESVPLQTRGNTCDLRGLRVDDGVSMATSFLDRAIGKGEEVVFLVHGHGTGALREAVREQLSRASYVSHFKSGPSEAGGDGVTVVWLT